MLKKLWNWVKMLFEASAEGLEMERYLSGAQNHAELEERMRRWERRDKQNFSRYL
jgi:hypothetical protein